MLSFCYIYDRILARWLICKTMEQLVLLLRKLEKYPYTLEELGKKSGYTCFLSRVENNKATPSDELLKIAGALDPFNSADLLNEFKILTGKFKDIDKNNEVYKELKASGRLEMPQYNHDKSKPLLVDKPYYKLNFLFENDYRVFYDLKLQY